MLNAQFRDPTTSAVLSGTITFKAVRENTNQTFDPFTPQNTSSSAPNYFAMTSFYGPLHVTATFAATAAYNAASVTATFQNVDNQGPTTPANFRRVVVGSNSFSVAWEPSSDASGGPSELITYELVLDGGAPVTATGVTHTFNGIAANTSHTIEIRARDFFGNFSAPASTTVSTSASGTDPEHDRRWIDVNGDGIPDEVVGGDSGVFYYYAAQTSSTIVTSVNWTTEYWPFPVGFGDGLFGYNWWWLPVPQLEYDTYTVNSVRPKFIFTQEPDYDYTICRVLSATQYVRLFPPTHDTDGEWQPAGFWPEEAYNALPFALARISKQLNYVSVAGVSGVLGVSRGTGGLLDIMLPSGGVIINVSDLANKIIKAGPQVVVDIWDAITNTRIGGGTTTLGGIINMANLGLTTSGEWHVGLKMGEGAMLWFRLTTRAPILEPIMAPTGSGVTPPKNPSGFEAGTQAAFEVSGPSSQASDYTWYGPADVTFVGSNSGKNVTITSTVPGLKTLEVYIAGHNGPVPQVTTNVFTKNIVKVSAWIVRTGPGGSAAATVNQVKSMIADVNTVFKQVAMEFSLETSPTRPDGNIEFIDNHPEWFDISSASNWAERNDLLSYRSGTGGIELYFVRSLEGDLVGVSVNGAGPASGIAIDMSQVSLNTLPHEIGHACMLQDVYRTKAIELPDTKANQAWLPRDWNNGPGPEYYPSGLKHREIVSGRLLMFGATSNFAVVIPRGPVYGYDAVGLPRLVFVGIANQDGSPFLLRTPVHP